MKQRFEVTVQTFRLEDAFCLGSVKTDAEYHKYRYFLCFKKIFRKIFFYSVNLTLPKFLTVHYQTFSHAWNLGLCQTELHIEEH